MSQQEQELNYVLPDLRELPLERLAELGEGESALAQAIALYRQRLQGTGTPLNGFNSSI